MLKSARSSFIPSAFLVAGFLGLALLLPAEAALAQVEIDPDEVLSDVAADDFDSNCVASCSVSADPPSTLRAWTTAGESETNDIRAILSAAFDVSAESGDPEDGTKLIGSMISLIVGADGELTATGADSSAGYRLDVQVVDASEGGMLVATQKLGESSVTDGAEDVSILETVLLPVLLTRGHSYRIELVLSLEATGDATGSASADFASTASWDDLTIAAGSDVPGAIADLGERVDALETDVAELDERVDLLEPGLDDLREDFENHTHEYLTGRGTGHNNTVATTTPPDVSDGSDGSPEPYSDDEGSTPAPLPVVEDDEEEEDEDWGFSTRRSRSGSMGLSDRLHDK